MPALFLQMSIVQQGCQVLRQLARLVDVIQRYVAELSVRGLGQLAVLGGEGVDEIGHSLLVGHVLAILEALVGRVVDQLDQVAAIGHLAQNGALSVVGCR